MKVIRWFRESYNLRDDWEVRFLAMIPAVWGLNIGLALTHGETPTSILYLLFILYLFFGVDLIAAKVAKRKAAKAEREATQMERAEAFEDRLDKSFGLDK